MKKISDADLIEQAIVQEARQSFFAYRRYIHGNKLKVGWFVKELCAELQQFHHNLVAGKRPKLAISTPPQHGKSVAIVDFITWASGHNPDLKTIYSSFSERLGIRANLMAQRIYDNPKYHKVFPETKINSRDNENSKSATRSREIIEYVNAQGYFRNTTVGGSITGESLDLSVVDDPIKGREEAGSERVRDKVWDWFTDDMMTRFSEDAGLLLIMTRWHIDDPIGRLIKMLGDGIKIVSYKAVASQDEKHRKAGEALFPDHKSIEFLGERKVAMASHSWEALFQQNPQIIGGEIIKGSSFQLYKIAPQIQYRMMYADTAQKTAERNDYSVLECWGRGKDGKIYLLDLIRGKWEAPELERRVIAFWNKHYAVERMGQLRQLKVEDKASGTGLIQSIKAKALMPIAPIERTKDKYTRLMDVLGYIESGYVCLPENAPFLNDFIAECEAFTADDTHMHDDQIDPMIDAINDMLASRGFDLASLL